MTATGHKFDLCLRARVFSANSEKRFFCSPPKNLVCTFVDRKHTPNEIVRRVNGSEEREKGDEKLVSPFVRNLLLFFCWYNGVIWGLHSEILFLSNWKTIWRLRPEHNAIDHCFCCYFKTCFYIFEWRLFLSIYLVIFVLRRIVWSIGFS